MTAPLRYIGFSGGGWHTHTVSSASMSAALQAARAHGASNSDFGVILNNYDGAAGNSGGSWFLTMLSYSSGFADALANQADDWFTTGYMGQQRNILKTNSPEAKDIIKSAVKDYLRHTVDSSPIYTALKGLPLVGALAADEFKNTATSINDSIVNVLIDNLDEKYSLNNFFQSKGINPMLAFYAGTNKLSWLEFIRNVAYQPYGMSAYLSRDIKEVQRNPWAVNLQIILPGSFDTSNTASFPQLSSLNPSYYTVKSEPNDKNLSSTPFITPVRIVLGSGTNPTNTLEISGSTFTQRFQQASLFSLSTDSVAATLDQQLSSELSIIEAASLSSAVAGDFSSIRTWENAPIDQLKPLITNAIESSLSKLPSILRQGVNNLIDSSFDPLVKPLVQKIAPLVSLFLRDVAVPLSVSNRTARYQNPAESFSSLSELAASQNQRFLDGGYVDNTTTASIISEIQSDHGTDQEFELTIFANNNDTATISKDVTGLDEDLKIPIDLAKLFGQDGDKQLQPYLFSGFSTEAAFPYIFKRSAWIGEKPVWHWDNKDKWKNDPDKATFLAYYKLNVETVDNPYFSIKGSQKGVLNVFASYNTGSNAAPNDFDLYENVYNATRDGIMNHGGYTYLLSAMNVMNIQADEQSRLTFASNEGLTHLVQLDLNAVETRNVSSIDIFKVSEDGSRVYSGSLGGANEEAGYSYDYEPQAIMMSDGDSLEFQLTENNSLAPITGSIKMQEVDEGYQLTGAKGDKAIFTAQASLAPVSNLNPLANDDLTSRDSSDDAYFYFESGANVILKVDSMASFVNRLSMIKIDLDPITGIASYFGNQIDSEGMNDFLAATFGKESSGSSFGDQQLQPFSRAEFEFTIDQGGYYAPVLLTREGNFFTLGHDMDVASTRARVIGDYAVGFEDLYEGADFDFNDAILDFEIMY